jgi:hypothetical protein
MPFQPINYAGIAPQGYSALDDLVSNLKGGIDLSQEPRTLASQNALREAQAAEASQKSRKEKMIANLLQQYVGGGQQGNGAGASSQGAGSPNKLGQYLFNKLVLGQTETPDMQQEREIQTARGKQESLQDLPTKSTLTKYQQSVNQVEPFIDKMQSIIELPSPVHLLNLPYRPSAVAAHEAAVNAAVDSYLAIKGWNPTKENIEVARGIISRHPFENDKSYRERIKKETTSALKGAIPYFEATKSKQPEVMQKILSGNHETFQPSLPTKTIGGITYVKRNGSWEEK